MLPRDETAPRHRGDPDDDVSALAPAAAAVVAVVAVAAVVVVAAVWLPGGEPASGGRAAAPPVGRGVEVLPGRGPVVRAAAVLSAWDERRARAWARGDVGTLRRLYVDRAGEVDVRRLRRYVRRGLRVEGLTTQLLAVEVLGSGPRRWRLRVTDRVVDAVAVSGAHRIRLPRDRVDTRVVTLVRGADGRWRVAGVRDA